MMSTVIKQAEIRRLDGRETTREAVYWSPRRETRDLITHVDVGWNQSNKRKIRDIFWLQMWWERKGSTYIQRTPADYHILNCSIFGCYPVTSVSADAWNSILFYFLLASQDKTGFKVGTHSESCPIPSSNMSASGLCHLLWPAGWPLCILGLASQWPSPPLPGIFLYLIPDPPSAALICRQSDSFWH